ncbi:MAG: hypothetical protein JHC87_08815, partial [Thermoleophilaceae bacterium]|nr:hypothetical protein [Thermoleophilaceae bacterium]
FKNRIFEYFAAATPGLTELLTIGKVWELAQPDRLTKGAGAYDLVVVDAPATGHALAMLEAPATFRRIARVGPINRQAGKIASFLHDPQQTAIVAVATGEEMPVNETLSLQKQLKERLDLKLDAVVVNNLEPQFFSEADSAQLRATETSPTVDAALRQIQRHAQQQEQLARLRKNVKAPVLTLPYIYEKSIGRSELATLSATLADDLGITPEGQ